MLRDTRKTAGYFEEYIAVFLYQNREKYHYA